MKTLDEDDRLKPKVRYIPPQKLSKLGKLKLFVAFILFIAFMITTADSAMNYPLGLAINLPTTIILLDYLLKTRNLNKSIVEQWYILDDIEDNQ